MDIVDDVPDAHPSITTFVFGVLSLKTVVAAVTFFGCRLGMAAPCRRRPLTIAILASRRIHLLRSVYRLAQSGNIRIANAMGQSATVYIPIPAGNQGPGKVESKSKIDWKKFPAVTSAGQALTTGANVVVVGVVGGHTLEVEPLVDPADDGLVLTLRSEKGVRNQKPVRPVGCFALLVPDPFFHGPLFR